MPNADRSAPDNDAIAAIRAARRLQELIGQASFAPGSRLPAERELASLIGFSRATVRRALDSLERDGLVTQASARVRRVAGAAVGGNTRRIAVLGGRTALGTLHGGVPSFIFATATACCERLREAGLVVLPTVAGTRSWAGLVAGMGRVDMVVALSDVASQTALTAWLARAGRSPLVVWAESLPAQWPRATAFDCVRHDHRAGAAMLMHALAAQGCRRPVVVWWEDAPGHAKLWWEADRLAGYAEGARQVGMAEPVVIHLPRPFGNPGVDTMRRLMFGFLYDALRQQFPCDAVLLVNDQLIPAAAAAVRMAGMTPGREVQLAGYDHSQAYGAPAHGESVATIDQDATALGNALAACVLSRLQRLGGPATATVVPPKLIA